MPLYHQIVADLEVLKHRATLMQVIRRFMSDRNVLEVDTPSLNTAGVTDPSIRNLFTELTATGDNIKMYLGTSPEFFMKRLLSAESGAIYQVCKVYRDDPSERYHQPEFNMLEWYRPGFDHMDLMAEINELLLLLGLSKAHLYEYREVFREHLQIDPFTCSPDELSSCARANGLKYDETDRDILLDFVFSHQVIPALSSREPFFIYHYPASQAALAKLSTGNPPHAERFELFYRGIELANGFHELTDASEQRSRFEKENRKRALRGEEEIVIDNHLLSALEQGIPDCAGVAIGIDRLLMTMLQKEQIKDVMSFPIVQE